MKAPPFTANEPFISSMVEGAVRVPAAMITLPELVAFAEKTQVPEPLKFKLLNGDEPGLIVFPELLELKSTEPLLCTNVPPVEVKLPPTVVVPTGRLTEPADTVKLLVEVAKLLGNDHVPPDPLKVRL